MERAHHCHSHHEKTNQKLGIILVLTGLFMITEFAGGIYTNSLALTADAGHMLSDVGALALSYFSIWISHKPASSEKTYGYFRTEILSAFINGIALVAIALFIIYDALMRMLAPPEIKAPIMIIIALGGLMVNLIGAFLLHKDSSENLNIKGAFLHILGDLLGSIGAVFAGIIILRWHFYLADPIISIIIALLILYSSITLINESVNVLLEAAPSHINVETIRKTILEVQGVIDVHDLHVWSLSSNKTALSVHIVAEFLDNKTILCNVNNLLKEKFNIHHSTIQIEPKDFNERKCFF